MRRATIAMGVAVIPAATLLFAGCGLGAGDYRLYRIASEETGAEGALCDGDPNDSTTLLGGSTIMLFFVEDGDVVPYLDTGAFVLEGTEGDESYEFSGTTIDVEDFGDGEITTTVDVSVSLTLDGDLASGTVVVDTTASCSGDCGGFDEESCRQTASFHGVEIEESVELQEETP